MILDRRPSGKCQSCLLEVCSQIFCVNGLYVCANGSIVQRANRQGHSKIRLFLLATVCLAGATLCDLDVAKAQSGPLLYVPNAGDDNVSVIDTSTNASVPPPIVTGVQPVVVGVRGDQSLAYVTNMSSNTVSVINTATNLVVATVNVGSSPAGLAVNPTGTQVYIGNTSDGTISVINTATNSVVTTIVVGIIGSAAIAFTPDGTRAYVANMASNNVSVINAATNTVIGSPIPVGNNPFGLSVSPDGTHVYVVNNASDTVSVIETATNTVVSTVAVGSHPRGVAVNPNGTRAFVTNRDSNTVSIIDTATNTVVATISVGANPFGVSFSPDGTRAYVTNQSSNDVAIIDTANNTVISTVSVGQSPVFPGICSNGNALLATGLTFTARTTGALACTLTSGPSGSPGPVFTGGTLQFAGTNIASALPISLQAAGGTFDTNGNNATLSGTISGPGGLTKIGAGSLMLSGTSTYSGDTNVNGGTLFVSGSIANSHTFVNSGGTLAGTGTVGSVTVNNGGIFAPGSGAAGSAMTVAGNLAFQSGALYLVQIDPSTASGANVTGSATLAGTVNATFATGSYVTRAYTILSATGGLNGTTFSGLTTSNVPAGFVGSLSYTPTAVILNLTGALGIGGGLSVNQGNVANALNSFFNSGGVLPPSFVSVFGLTGSNLANALTLLSGEPATGAQQGAFQLTSQFLGIMLDPFVDGRSGVGGSGGPALGFAPDRPEMPEEIALAYSKVMKTPVYKSAPVTFEQRWTAWGAGYGGYNKTSGDPAVIGSHDLIARTAGYAAGLDYHFTRDTVAGFALAGGGTNWSLAQGLGGGRSDAFQAGAYAATRSGPAYLAASFAFANHWMSTDRFAAFGDHLTAEFKAQSFGGRVETGYRFGVPVVGVTPYAAVQAQSFRTPGYSEVDATSGGFGLSYNSRTGTDTRSELGARFDHVAAFDRNAVLTLRGRLAWAHDWVTNPTLAAAFQVLPGTNFIVNGATPAKNSALASAGAELRLVNGVTLSGKFDGEFARGSQTYAGTGTIRYTW
jgi:YVTN family beta-propeller protein/autotransporter-associated beta strand protein